VKPTLFDLTPRQIVRELDQYIIGQEEAKRAVAIALRNRWRRRRVQGEIGEEILPNNILMIGPTGVGKTEIARRLARLAGAPFIKVEASKYTEVGYVGRDVEGMIRDLVEAAVAQVRAEFTANVEEEAESRVEERLLDLLLPPPTAKQKRKPRNGMFESLLDTIQKQSGMQDEDDPDQEEYSSGPSQSQPDASNPTPAAMERYQRTREKLRTQLREGKLTDRQVEIQIPERSGGMLQVFGPMGIEEMGVNLQEMLGPMMPNRKKRRRVSLAEAESIMLSEEIDRLVDMDSVITEALHRASEMGIVFIDEIDKIVSGDESGGSGPDVSREGVQRDILPIVEGTRVTTKYGPINTDHILFIAAGAFHVARPADLIPELQGRFPIRVEMKNLGKKEFLRILTEPRNALIKQYAALIETEGAELEFQTDALRTVAEYAEILNERMENIGARRLHTVMTSLLDDILFKLPSARMKKVVITRKQVRETLENLIEDEDLTRYIL